MLRARVSLCTTAFVGLLLASTTVAQAAERSVPEILQALDAVRMPDFDQARRSEPGYVAKFQQELIHAGARRDVLILELFHADPNHDRLPKLMNEHWRRLPPEGENEARLKREIADVLAHTTNEKLKVEADFAQAQGDLYQGKKTGTLDMSGVEQFVRKFPKDERAELLLYIATMVTHDEKVKVALEDRIINEYPKGQFAETVVGARRQRAAIGQPFELDFTDAVSGSKVSVKDLKGKIVVVDFWATWCPPCVAEMPHMKELYSKYHDHGVEFIGVSLDKAKEEGGLESLKGYVKENGIPWPQYYQGKFWEGDFSKSWGINAIPAIFVVDAEGKLDSVQGVGKLDKIIPELLAKKGTTSTSAAGAR